MTGNELVPSVLKVRNISNSRIIIKEFHVTFLALQESTNRFAENVTKLSSIVTFSPDRGDLNLGSLSSTLACSVTVAPSSIACVDIPVSSRPARLAGIIFSIDGRLLQTRLLHDKCHAQDIVPVDGDDKSSCKHIALYHPAYQCLTIAFQDRLHCWMRHLRDSVYLSALSIPGTHNSPSYRRALPSVRCQYVSIDEQLRQGIRFLDVRAQPVRPNDSTSSEMVLVHGAFGVSISGTKSLKNLVECLKTFLKRNPSETLIVSLKREGTGSCTDEQFSRILFHHYTRDEDLWYTDPRIPRLGEARGKIVLLRRFQLDGSLLPLHDGHGWGINADCWADNTPQATCQGGNVCIQDFYAMTQARHVQLKIEYAIAHLKRAGERLFHTQETDPDLSSKVPFYLNFLTASNFWRPGCWPEKIAHTLNPAILEYLCLEHNDPENQSACHGHGSTGIVICDWVGLHDNWDIVRSVIGMNATFEETKNASKD